MELHFVRGRLPWSVGESRVWRRRVYRGLTRTGNVMSPAISCRVFVGFRHSRHFCHNRSGWRRRARYYSRSAGPPERLLATGRERRPLPERILGKSAWWWLDKLGLVRLSGGTALARRMRKADPFPGKGHTLKHLRAQRWARPSRLPMGPRPWSARSCGRSAIATTVPGWPFLRSRTRMATSYSGRV
jgi:hypothetical protein